MLPSRPRKRRLGSMRSGWCVSWASSHRFGVVIAEPGPFSGHLICMSRFIF
jgi:hypothetical protein